MTTVMAAATAAIAAAGRLALSLPVRSTFIGWIAFFTHGLNTRSTSENLACVGLGISRRVIASFSILKLASIMGLDSALPMVVFVVALVVVALRACRSSKTCGSSALT